MRFLIILLMAWFLSNQPARAMVDRSPEASLAAKSNQGDLEARAKLLADAAAGNPRDQFFLGELLSATPTECSEAIEWLRKASEQAHAQAQLRLSNLYRNGCGQIAPDFAEAYYWELIGKRTNEEFPWHKGYLRTDFIPNDFGIPVAIKIFERKLTNVQIATVKQRAAAWQPTFSEPLDVAFAWELDNGKKSFDGRDFNESIKTLAPLAARNIAEAQYYVGTQYLKGLGVKQDKEKGVELIRKAADQGYVPAQIMMGNFFKVCTSENESDNCRVITDKHDDLVAMKWFNKAAEHGNLEAQYDLGLMYEEGRGVKTDSAEAVKWYLKSAEQGPPVSQNLLEALYKRKGKEGYTFAIRHPSVGSDSAQAALSYMYENGHGVKQDYVQAYMWQILYIARHEGTNDELNYLSKKMTPKEIAEARRLAASWKPVPNDLFETGTSTK